MREIKFRAWDNLLKRWLYIDFKTDDFYSFIQEHGWNVSDLEWCQFIGLKDRNNKEIYEGDIVTYNGFVVKGIVKYGRYKRQAFMNGDQPHENIGFYIKGIPEKSKSGLSNTHEYPLIQLNNVIIVGNTFENPSLMVSEQEVD